MKANREIRAPRVRLISQEGEQVGVVPLYEALAKAEEAGLDLVEIVPGANPPVCKIIDYGKFRYDQTKRERENKKSQHQVKVKELKLKPNIGDHDLETKINHARDFLEAGNKVKVTCTFKGREMAHPEVGLKHVKRICDSLEKFGTPESWPPKMLGRMMSIVIAPGVKKTKDSSSQEVPLE